MDAQLPEGGGFFLGAHGNQTVTPPFVSYYIYTIFRFVNGHFLCNALGVFGICSNVANLVVFSCLGLSETMNIKLFALSVVDLIVSACLVGLNTMHLLQDLRLVARALLEEMTVTAILVLQPTLGCGAILTALISTERCLCIAKPWMAIVTPRVTWLVISVAVVYELACLCLLLTRSLYDRDRSTINTILACSFSAPFLVCFFIVSVATIFLFTRLRRNLTWRAAFTTPRPQPQPPPPLTASSRGRQAGGVVHSVRELRACRCAVAICTIFIICYTPSLASQLALTFNPSLTLRDPYYKWLPYIFSTFMFLLQAISSSVNVLFYYSISSRYRGMFRRLLGCGS